MELNYKGIIKNVGTALLITLVLCANMYVRLEVSLINVAMYLVATIIFCGFNILLYLKQCADIRQCFLFTLVFIFSSQFFYVFELGEGQTVYRFILPILFVTGGSFVGYLFYKVYPTVIKKLHSVFENRLYFIKLEGLEVNLGFTLKKFSLKNLSIAFYQPNKEEFERALVLLVTAIFATVLLVFGTAIGGTKISIHITDTFSIQLIEPIKMLMLWYMALLITSEDVEYDKKPLYVFSMLCVLALYFVLIEELGTLLVIGISSLVLSYTTFSREQFKELLIYGFIACLFALILSVISTKIEIPKISKKTYQVLNRLDPANQEYTTILKDRYNFDLDDTTKIESLRAITAGSWLGFKVLQLQSDCTINVCRTDQAIAAYINFFGILQFLILSLCIVLFVYDLMICNETQEKTKKNNIFLFAIFSQLLIIIQSNIGFAVVGIDAPFFSLAITYSIILYSWIYHSIYNQKEVYYE